MVPIGISNGEEVKMTYCTSARETLKNPALLRDIGSIIKPVTFTEDVTPWMPLRRPRLMVAP